MGGRGAFNHGAEKSGKYTKRLLLRPSFESPSRVPCLAKRESKRFYTAYFGEDESFGLRVG